MKKEPDVRTRSAQVQAARLQIVKAGLESDQAKASARDAKCNLKKAKQLARLTKKQYKKAKAALSDAKKALIKTEARCANLVAPIAAGGSAPRPAKKATARSGRAASKTMKAVSASVTRDGGPVPVGQPRISAKASSRETKSSVRADASPLPA